MSLKPPNKLPLKSCSISHSGHSWRLCSKKDISARLLQWKLLFFKYSFKTKAVVCRSPLRDLLEAREDKASQIQIKQRQLQDKYDSQSKWEGEWFSESQVTYVRACVYSLQDSKGRITLEQNMMHSTKPCIGHEGSVPFSGVSAFWEKDQLISAMSKVGNGKVEEKKTRFGVLIPALFIMWPLVSLKLSKISVSLIKKNHCGMSTTGLSHSERQMLADAYRIALWNVNAEIVLWFFFNRLYKKTNKSFWTTTKIWILYSGFSLDKWININYLKQIEILTKILRYLPQDFNY